MAEQEPQPDVQGDPEPSVELGDGGKKALEAERAAVKELKAQLAERDARLNEFEDRDKTEQQKLAERAEKAEQALAAQKVELARQSALITHSVPAEYAGLVTGDTPEALEASAQKVAQLVASSSQKPQPLIIPAEGKQPPALNSTALEDALRKAVGAE